MNKKVKDGLNSFVGRIANYGGNVGKGFISILRMCVLSSMSVALRSREYNKLKTSKNCCVLGNGPSLKDDFEKGRVVSEGNDIFCVNLFCSSPLFWQLKPKFYFLIDSELFTPTNDRALKVSEELKSAFDNVDWEIYLVVSSSVPSHGNILEEIKNKNVNVIRMNTTEVDGARGFRHWIYRHRLGMPRCQSVINFALCTAIDLGYENIYLYGADHTWTRDLFVDENNVVCYGDRHVYNKKLVVVKKGGNFAHLLGEFANMFKSHYLLEEYSKSKGVKIWNCTGDTFLDAYERLSQSN